MATDDIISTLPPLLSTVKRPGEFFATGAIDLPVIRAHVDGLGGLGLPIPPAQAKALARLATPAPYGRGPDTLVDPTVRRCGQIPASAVHLDGRSGCRCQDSGRCGIATDSNVQTQPRWTPAGG